MIERISAFAYASNYLYSSYNYAYGIKETERHIAFLKENPA